MRPPVYPRPAIRHMSWIADRHGSRLLSDKIFRVSGDWSLASDPLQWILMRKTHPVSFVRSTKEILARCMRDKGTPPEDAQRLLDGLPATFDEWLLKAADSAPT